MFYSTAPPACSLLTILAQTFKSLNCFSSILPVITRRSTSHSTVLRGSCLLYMYYRILCHFRSGLSATVIKEYCIASYCIAVTKTRRKFPAVAKKMKFSATRKKRLSILRDAPVACSSVFRGRNDATILFYSHGADDGRDCARIRKHHTDRTSFSRQSVSLSSGCVTVSSVSGHRQ